MMANSGQEVLEADLKRKKICRFCLSQDFSKISNIYMRDTRIKSSAPLPIQIMAIASIEVFSNDGMPSFICSDCINIFEYSYQFKQMCKKADNLLRQFPLTGVWPTCLDKPAVQNLHFSPTPIKMIKSPQITMKHSPKTNQVNKDSLLMPKKILNTAHHDAAKTTEADLPKQSERAKDTIPKIEKDTDFTITFLEKIENNEELSIYDIHQLVAAEEINETEEENTKNLIVLGTENKPIKPKLLNKSSIRILNKDAEQGNEPRLSVPKVKQAVNGKTEIIAEILNADDVYEDEPDPKNAAPIETNVFPCPECERSFPLLQLRDLHMKNHTRDRKFHCEHCEKSFFSKYDLHRHLFIHNGEKPFKCALCEKAFSRSSLLTRHEKSHTDAPKLICIHCERPFISKEDLKKHEEKHSINRPFKCKICNKGFAFKQGLERHEVVHSRQQPFSCQYCSESFSTTTKLARHLTAHAGRRPYPCKFCRKSYLLSHHLTRHMRSHKNDDDSGHAVLFTCMQCDQNFPSRENLIAHSSTHANETNLQCSMCKDGFSTMAELVTHIEEHSSGELFACEFCDLIFTSADKLELHTASDHIYEMEAYHADDRAQADKMKKEQNNKDMADERLQNTVNEFLSDDQFAEENNSQNSLLKKNVKSEKSEKQSVEIINKIVIRSVDDDKKRENITAIGSSLLIPLKQRKLNLADKKEATQVAKESPQLRRKTASAAGTAVKAKDPNQPSINSMFKPPKSVAISKASATANTSSTRTPPTKTTATKTPPTKTTSPSAASTSKTSPLEKNIKSESLLATKFIKLEKDLIETASSSTNVDSSDKAQAEKRKCKVQKITVTKAQAAAMAKEGRIKIKDGKIILKK